MWQGEEKLLLTFYHVTNGIYKKNVLFKKHKTDGKSKHRYSIMNLMPATRLNTFLNIFSENSTGESVKLCETF